MQTANRSTVGADRIAYWYGSRDWSISDHFAGPGALLEGAQHATGGPNDPTVTAEAYNRASTIIAQAIDALSRNGSYTAETLSDPAARSFVRAITPYLDDFAKHPLSERSNSSDKWLIGRDPNVPQPPKSAEDALAKVFGGLMGREASASMIREATARVITQEYERSLASGDPEALQQALDRIAGLSALVSGSGLGAPIAAAEQSAADAQADRDAWAGLLGHIPVPGGAAAGIAASLLLDGALGFADHLSAQDLEALLRSAEDNQNALANVFHTQMTASILTAHDTPFTPPPSWDDALTQSGGDTNQAADTFGRAAGDWLYQYEVSIPANLRTAISGAANHYGSHLFGAYEWSRK
ncbi:hypothetical protein ACL9RL_16770 [Plantibacter sp. Mn2098]|uniref:hypothetical protein n=1 Tax=Plantibacter sp. Mn2098 TaxID=3395266 RepID=UPI003BDF5FD4